MNAPNKLVPPDTEETRAIFGLLRADPYLFGIEATALGELAPVTALEPFLSDLPEILGTIRLRGTVVPVLDPAALAGLPPRQSAPPIAAILWAEDTMIALAIDSVVALHRTDWGVMQKLDLRRKHPVLGGHLPLDGETVNIIDTDRIFRRADLPRAVRQRRKRMVTKQTDLTAYLAFESGGIAYAVNVADIFNTVPGQALRETEIANGAFLGNTEYLGRRIPVVDVNMVMQIDARRQNMMPEIVVLHMEDGHLLGLAVDRILQIAHFGSGQLSPLAPHLRTNAPFIDATLRNKSGADSATMPPLILDATAIRQDAGLISISQISDTASPKARRRGRSEQHTDGTALGEIIRERKRMLIFDAGVELSTPIRDVTSVHELPRHVTPWQKPIPGLLGLFQHEAQMLPLFHLGAHLQGGSAVCEMPAAGRVLISGMEDQKLGFLIEKVTGIALSDWWSGPDSTLDGDLGTAHIQNWPQDRVLPRIRLAERAQSLLARLSSQ